ncbi:MAG: 4Fe-4S dicluster domain-containing protein [Rhodospirillaceae bacterium]|nr:4Fe-4S dicluster domain-containing protein [Rhodospirillaceae bacterium]
MTRWAMVADLRRCVGCQTCTSSCKHTNATPPLVQWRRVLDIETGEFPDVQRTFVPVGCMHCADPPCMHVCPSTATRQREDGIVTIDYDLCIGCAYCAVACPYQARYKVDLPKFAFGADQMRHEAAREMPERLGVAQKCTFCSDRVDFGLENGLTPGIDPDATPACVNSCIADALHFGDADDPTSNVSTLLRENRHFRMHEELGTDPGFHYLWDGDRESLDEATGGAMAASELDPVRGEDTGAQMPGVMPWQQTHWDWRAAGNFIFGGTGSGMLAGIGAIALTGFPPPAWLALAGLAFIAAGLFLVWTEIGRMLRFLHVVLHPQTSWMTREAMVALLVFASGALALLTPWPGWIIAVGLFALLFLYCQGRILHEAKGIPVWREPRIVLLIFATGLVEGCGLLLAASSVLSGTGSMMLAAALLILIALRAFTWRGYLQALLDNGAPAVSLDILSGLRPWMAGLGAVALSALILGGVLFEPFAPGLFALAGLLALAAGWLFKFTLVTGASFNQGFAIERTPARGDGPPGAGVKPGWR